MPAVGLAERVTAVRTPNRLEAGPAAALAERPAAAEHSGSEARTWFAVNQPDRLQVSDPHKQRAFGDDCARLPLSRLTTPQLPGRVMHGLVMHSRPRAQAIAGHAGRGDREQTGAFGPPVRTAIRRAEF
ncbi:hypothetical protein GCM10022222_16850 [Amycolatopsis ultiminotia]|uniref:Uncharacterized protein n=1 Tax=Amycolatopsis ultiminotia TaxID=543629 RepID=A0ABP6VHB1_9PSEU